LVPPPSSVSVSPSVCTSLSLSPPDSLPFPHVLQFPDLIGLSSSFFFMPSRQAPCFLMA
jgi:hypothetical protein